uniref:Uncharacterized protein n=1 Tax=Romanomermis culicivorax TaxID=13658 RepID=A0A915HYC4_ROMCU
MEKIEWPTRYGIPFEPYQAFFRSPPSAPGPPASSDSAPPLPPPRSDSLISEFEKRFRFRTLALLPSPEEHSNNSKNYGNFRNGRKPAPRIP